MAGNQTLSEKVTKIKLADEELRLVVFENFQQPEDEQNYIKPKFNHIQNVQLHEYNTLDILLNRGFNFYIDGIPVLQWEKGQSIGSALLGSFHVANQAIIRRLEANFRFQSVRLGTQLFNKIKENLSSIGQEKNPEHVEEPVYDYYPLRRDDNPGVNSNLPINQPEPNVEVLSQNSRLSNNPVKLLSSPFSNDLRKAITQLDELQNAQLNSNTFPFYFKNINNNETCFFNAFFDNISENMSANWSKMEFFGRTQGISKYINTEWTVSIAFNVIPERDSDLDFIYKKLDWLKKMNYPKYNEYNSYQEVPLIRFTIGNLFSNLGGYISSLSFDYDMTGNWEVRKGKQLPRKIMVNMDFSIIKDEMPSNETEFYDNIGYDEELVYYK